MFLRNARCRCPVAIICLALLAATQTGNLRGAAPTSAEQVLHEARQALDAGRWDDAARALAVAQAASDDQDFQQRVAVCRRELFTVVRLDELRYDNPTNAYGFDRDALHAAYRETFRGYGLDAEKADEEMKRRGRLSPIRTELIAGLDEWARIFRVEDDRRNLLLEFADALDDSEQRRSVRAALRDNDGERLRLLAKVADVKALTPATLLLLERTLCLLGEMPASEELLRRGQKAFPSDFWILVHLGELLTADKPTRAEEGVRCLRAALALRPGNLRPQRALAVALWTCKHYQEAETAARDAIQTRPQSMDTHLVLLSLLEEQGKHAEGDAACRAAGRLNGGNAASQCLRGQLLGLRQQWHNAEGVFREVLRFEPGNAEAMAYLGAVLVAQRRYLEAEPVLREALHRGSDWDELHLALGVALVATGQCAEGEKHLREYLHCNPGDPSARAGLALAVLQQGRAVEADLACREALRAAPDDRRAKYVLARALLAENMPAEAETMLRELLRADDSDEATWSSLGAALVQQKRVKEAEAHYRTAVKRFPDAAQLRNDLGGVLALQGRFDEAEALLREALRLAPAHVQARSNLIEVLKRTRRYDEALAILRAAVAANRDDATAWRALAEICSTMTAYEEAETAARALVRLSPASVDVRCNLAVTLEFQGRFDEALAEMRRLPAEVLEAVPVVTFARARLEREARWDRQMPAIVSGALTPADAVDTLAMARMCLIKGQPAAAVRLFEEGRRQSPQAFTAAEMCYRCLAALAAVQAATVSTDATAQARLRRQGLDWLREEIAVWSRKAEEQESDRALAERLAAQWQQGKWLTSVRGTALDHLPADERDGWAQLWREVEALRQRCAPGCN